MSDFKTRMQLLVRQAGQVNPAHRHLVFAFSHADGRYFLFPIDDFGTPRFESAIREAGRTGFKPLALIALCATDDGRPLVEDEPMPDAPPDKVKAARQIFMDELIQKGILKPGNSTSN